MDMTTQAKLNIPKQPDTQFLWGWQYHQVIGIIWITGSSSHQVIDDYEEEDAAPSSHLNHLNHRTTKSSWQFGSAETS